MKSIHICKTLDSDTLYLPELQSLIGKSVEITVTEKDPECASDWSALEELAGKLTDYDFDAYKRQREFDARHQNPPQL